jgi:hypothetical protein
MDAIVWLFPALILVAVCVLLAGLRRRSPAIEQNSTRTSCETPISLRRVSLFQSWRSKHLSALCLENRSSAKARGGGEVKRKLILGDVGKPLCRGYSRAWKAKDFHLPSDLKVPDAGG